MAKKRAPFKEYLIRCRVEYEADVHTVPPKVSLNPNDPEAWRRYKTVASWMVYGVKAASVLRRLLPYLQIKRERALAAIAVVKP